MAMAIAVPPKEIANNKKILIAGEPVNREGCRKFPD